MTNKSKFNLEYFKALVAIAMADGILKEEEKSFFERRAQELDFPIATITELLNTHVDDLKTQLTIDIDNIDFITDIVAMAMVDGHIVDQEYQLCISLAKNIGVPEDEIDKTIRTLKQLLKK